MILILLVAPLITDSRWFTGFSSRMSALLKLPRVPPGLIINWARRAPV